MTNEFKFLHAADLHLDTPFTGLSKVDTELADELRRASIRAFDTLIETAVRRKVEFVLFAGDIYDGANRGLRAQLVFERGLQRLDQCRIQSFVIHGNHDPLEGWSLIRNFPPTTHVFGGDYESVPVLRDGMPIAMVHGISYETRHVHDNLASRFTRSGDCFQIGLLHTEVDSPMSNYAPCSLEDLIVSGMDYWALGHIHDRHELCQDPLVVYPGNHQGRSFNEEGPRGVSLVKVRDGRIHEHEFVAVDEWRFDTLTVDISEAADLPELSALVHTRVEGTQARRPRIVRIQLHGRGPVHRDLIRTSTEELLGQIREDARQFRPRVCIARVEDKTRPDFDIEDVLERDDFSSEIVRVAVKHEQKPRPLNAVPKKHRGSLDRYLGNDPKSADELLASARDLAIELLNHRGEA